MHTCTHTHTHTFTHTLVTPGVALAPSCRPQHNDDDDEEKDEEPAFGYSGMLRLSVCVEQLCGVLTGVSVCVCGGEIMDLVLNNETKACSASIKHHLLPYISSVCGGM